MRGPKSTIYNWLLSTALALLFNCLAGKTFGQTSGVPGSADSNATKCGQKEVNDILFKTHPEFLAKHILQEQSLRTFLKSRAAHSPTQTLSAPSAHPAPGIPSSPGITLSPGIISSPGILAAPIVLSVVVHIIHNGGPEDITDAQVLTAIQHLNEAYANTGYYDPSDGVNTNIQFCMAERDPNNNATNGITRDVSPYTVMGGPQYYSDDQNVKNINRWNPDCYINIWVVRSIPGSVVGYAYLPPAHGTNLDGIVLEAGYFGSSYPNDVVIAHEMGHYLGLYHTFEGGCTNNDCTIDGDQVCDTPPDNSTAYISCGSSMNSCTTDALSGFATDQPDLTQDYMDYGNFNCMKVFTQGQSDRMNWYIQNVRSSLLHCKSCMPPCPSPAIAAFGSPASPVNAGSAYTFINSSANAGSYQWLVNGAPVSTTTNLLYTFAAPGVYRITLIANSGNPLCDSATITDTLTAICPVAAGFTKSATTSGAGTPINFTNTSAGASLYQWSVNGVPQSGATNFSYTTTTAGTYIISLTATNPAASCSQSFTDTVYFTCPVVADFIPLSTTTVMNTPLTFTSTGSGATGYQWAIDGVPSGTGTSLTNSFPTPGSYSVRLTATNGVCGSTKTGVVYVVDKCGNAIYLYRKNYSAQTNYIWRDIQTAPDGGSITAGRIIAGATPQGALMKLDPGGNPQWSKSYGNGNPSDLVKVRTTQDGGYIAIGSVTPSAGSGGSSGSIFIVKTAADGTLTWSRQISLDGACGGTNIIQSAEGDYYFTGSISSVGAINSGTDGLIGKLNTAGNLVWFRSYDARGNETPNSLAAETTTLIVCGNIQDAKGNQGFLLQVAKTDGSVTWSNTYQSVSENFRDVLLTPSGYFIDVLRSPSPAAVYSDHVYLLADATGNLVWSRYITPFAAGTNIGYSSVILKTDGNLVTQSSPAFGGAYEDFLVQELNPGGGVVWSKKYNEPNTYIAGLAVKPDNSLFLGGLTIGRPDPELIALDSSGNGGTCPANPFTIPILPTSYTIGQATWTSKNAQPAIISNQIATDFTTTTNTECQYVACDSVVDSCALCQTLHLAGKDSVCGIANAVLISAIRDTSCHSAVKWTTDTNYIKIITSTDSTISVSVRPSASINPAGSPSPPGGPNPGVSVILIGSITTPCKTISDTLTLHIFQQPDSIDLGPDIQLCSQSTLRLNAGSGFASYTWQDGSTDSFYTAYFPGTYFVNATDHCGNAYGDTIQITQAPAIPFDLGPDTTICLHDTVRLNAPAGFASYSWSPIDYAISDPYSAATRVYPEKDTSYTCVAQKYPGCTVVDTIHITVLPGVTANFLADSGSFCKGESLDLIPTGVWESYLWSDGETSPAITINSPGLYWLKVADANTCTGRDSILVTEADCLKGIHFPNAFSPNGDGHNDLFRAIFDVMPLKYELVVYDRWGEKVFETHDPLGGWNGCLGGQMQAPGGFVWYAIFQFAGDPRETRMKGTVILLH